MFLAIDITPAEPVICIYHSGQWFERMVITNRPGNMLTEIVAFMNELGASAADLQGVTARIGVGRFTSTRVATTIANTLAYALRIPVIPWWSNETTEEIIARFSTRAVGQYILPTYSAPAHIG